MRKSFKNILSLLLTLSMIFSIVGVPVFANDSIEIVGEDVGTGDTGDDIEITATIDGSSDSSEDTLPMMMSEIAVSSEEDDVAKIGETVYATLAEAVAAATAGDTILLYANVGSMPTIDKAITIITPPTN